MGDNTRTINKHANTSYSIGNRNTDYTCCGYYLVSLQYILKAPYIRLDLCTKQGFFYYLQKKTSPRCKSMSDICITVCPIRLSRDLPGVKIPDG